MLALCKCNAITFKSVVDHFDIILISLTSNNRPTDTNQVMAFGFYDFASVTHMNNKIGSDAIANMKMIPRIICPIINSLKLY